MRRKGSSARFKLNLPFLFLALLLCGCGIKSEISEDGKQAYTAGLFAMDTYMIFTAYGENADMVLDDVKVKMTELEKLWSVTDESSEIYQVNHSNMQWITLEEETAGLITYALEMAEKTGGALEPTIYPVLAAWGFTTEEKHVPTDEEIKQLLEAVGYDRVVIDGNRVALGDGMMLDLGAVGKGYAGDLAVEILREQGITSALLDIGGNIQAVGSKPDGSNWRVGIRSPYGEGNLGVLEISDMAVVTSGCYERYFIGEDGKQYGHIIDPATGYPVENGLMSVIVIAKEGRLCDALSTSLFVMGLERAADYWRSNPGFDMILVTEDSTVYLTEGVREQFVLSNIYHGIEVQMISRDSREQ